MINELLNDPARLAEYAPWLAAPALLAAAAITAVRVVLARWRQGRLARDARLVEIMAPPEAELAGAAVFWAQMLGLLRPAWRRLLLGQPHLAWEYIFTPGGMRIQLWVPGTVPPGLVERTVASAWPGAQTRTRPTSPPADGSSGGASGGVLRLARPDHFPLRHDFPEDPLRGLIGAAGMLTGDETVTVQVLARPVTGRRLRRAQATATQLRMGHHSGSHGWRGILDLLTPGTSQTRRPHPFAYRQPPEVTADVRHIMDKAAHPRLETLLRYTVTTPSDSPADRERRRGRAHAIAAAMAVYTGANHYRRRRLHTPTGVARRRMGRGDLLSVPELAAIAHLPLDLAVPGLRRAPARRVPPAPTVPAEGARARLLGDADTGPPRSIAVTVAGTRHHTQIIGGTGTGKTTAMFGMALSDVEASRALVLIEPKGESDQLLARLPEDAGDRLVLFDPQLRRPPSLNVLHGGEPSLVADTIVGIFARIYADHWGPRTDDVLRSACLTLATHPATTLADIPRLLGDAGYRRRMTEPITDPALKGFWTWFESLSPGARAQATGPIMNKLRAVLLRRFARAVLAAGRATVDLPKVLDSGGIVLARLPKGVLGEDTSRLLGSLILAQVWQAVLARAPRPERQRPDLSVYIDECHNFLTLPHGVDDMLAEARAYRCGLVLAHQHLAQLPTSLREAIAANARNKLIFAVSPEDAASLTRHVHPNLDAHDLAHLDRFQAAARVVHQQALAPACTLRTRPLPGPVRGRAQSLRTTSQARFGGPSLNHNPHKRHTDPRTHIADGPDKE